MVVFGQDSAEWSAASGVARFSVRLVGLLALIWSGFWAFDFLMINTRDYAYVSALHPETLQFLDVLPYDAIASWALAIACAGLASLLLLARSHLATPFFALSLVSLVYFVFRQWGQEMAPSVEILGFPAGMAAGCLVSIALPLFSLRCSFRDLLR